MDLLLSKEFEKKRWEGDKSLWAKVKAAQEAKGKDLDDDERRVSCGWGCDITSTMTIGIFTT